MAGCENLPYSVDDFVGIAGAVKEKAISLVVVGPELPLSLGIADYLQQEQIPVFGPSQAGALIESSKSWAKELMLEAGVPTAVAQTFTEATAAKNYVAQQGAPIVIKADGLAAGKGVVIAATIPEAQGAIDSLFNQGFSKLVVEEFLTGQEVSILALTDGVTIRPLLPSQDHKQIGEGDTGANTGGMGAYAPTPIVTSLLQQRIKIEVLQPTLAALQKRGIDYRGVLYAGLMVTPAGEPKVLEFNCRFGDPETQAVLSLLETPLEELMLACVEQRLGEMALIKWRSGSAVCVVAAAGGYPGAYEKGKVITGTEEAEKLGATVFHAGTKLESDKLVTAGGRVLGITAVGADFAQAITAAYEAVKCIQFEGIYYRRDIGHRVRDREE